MPESEDILPACRGKGASVLLVTTCWWPAFARLAHLLKDMGCSVAILCPTGHPARKIAGIAVFEQWAFRPLAALSAAIGASRPAIVIPGDERAARHLHRLHESGTAAERQLIERSLGSPAGYATTMSRIALLQRAARLALPVPPGQAVSGRAELAAWLANTPAPWVVKADGSWGGMGVAVVDTARAARAALSRLRGQAGIWPAVFRLIVNRDPFWLADRLRGSHAALSVQSFIRGRPADLAMFCWQGEVRAALMGEAVTSLGANRPTAIIRLIDRPDMLDAARHLARDMQLTGFYGLDFMIEDGTGRAYLLEMNPRPTSLTNIRASRGGDLLGALFTALSGESCAAPAPLPQDAVVAYFPLAWQGGHPDDTHPEAHHDIPATEPALMHEMLRLRWPERQMLARLECLFRQRGSRILARLKRGWALVQRHSRRAARRTACHDGLAAPAPVSE